MATDKRRQRTAWALFSELLSASEFLSLLPSFRKVMTEFSRGIPPAGRVFSESQRKRWLSVERRIEHPVRVLLDYDQDCGFAIWFHIWDHRNNRLPVGRLRPEINCWRCLAHQRDARSPGVGAVPGRCMNTGLPGLKRGGAGHVTPNGLDVQPWRVSRAVGCNSLLGRFPDS